MTVVLGKAEAKKASADVAVIFTHGSLFPTTKYFQFGQYRIGRDSESSDIVIHDDRMSRLHAVIEFGPKVIEIMDQGSSNGMLVNGQAMASASLSEFDTVMLGSTTLAFSILPPRSQRRIQPLRELV